MPRSARLDAPGLTHHVMGRGIERSPIFKDDTDRYDFLKRLSGFAGGDRMQVMAFCLMPNHFHLLTRTLSMPLSVFMRRLLTGYSTYFNRRHRRAGHLFQNRFKSFVVDEENYSLELVRYIHLNPIRAKIVDFDDLEAWPFCGHGTIMGKTSNPWFDTDEVLSRLSTTTGSARRLLKQFMSDGLSMGRRSEFGGGGLKRSLELSRLSGNQQGRMSYDERILGDGEFVDRIIGQLQKAPEPKPSLSLDDLVRQVAANFDLTPAEICSGSKRRPIVKARATVVWRGTKELGLKAGELAEALNVKPTAVYMSLATNKAEVVKSKNL